MSKNNSPSMDAWLAEAKAQKNAYNSVTYLIDNPTVRESARDMVRHGRQDTRPVVGMQFSYDQKSVDEIIPQTSEREGIYYSRVWLNQGVLSVGDDIMYVLIGGDIRPRVVAALDELVGRIKRECVTETELYADDP